ncbi:MAG: SAV_2336 N-terminal domain-related protein [Leptolyngbyaceae cyanobacterium MO_188.B28]|nr:SAV_2336 N-terminal domain-related protein [Leptolyngbyaceae cyanobacterium MO_188.B28]
MIDQLIAQLEQTFDDLTAEEIADILWLTLQQWQSNASTAPNIEPADGELTVLEGEPPSLDALPPPPPPQMAPPSQPGEQESTPAGITTRAPQTLTGAQSATDSAAPLAIPDSPALRHSLDILKAIRPLIRTEPSAKATYLDVPATVKLIAETDLWLLKLLPVQEPWLELALVVDATPSMVIWQRTLLNLRRVLAQSGVFRDVRLWSLETVGAIASPTPPVAEHAKPLCIRSGFGAATATQPPCRPQELLDPNGRRLILVVSDCIDSRWDAQPIRDLLEVWGRHGPLGLVQVLPEWLWSRTALSQVMKGQMVGLRPGQPSQALGFFRRDRWRRQALVGVKVPVMTLEPAVVSRWSQMVAGRSAVRAPGLVFSPVTVQSLSLTPEPDDPSPAEVASERIPQERLAQFRDFSSLTARQLAGCLAACPEVNLPVIRMVQAALAPNSQQVHVAEVLLGGLFKSQTDITAHTPADQVQYVFHDGVRPLVQDTVSPDDAFAALSAWLNHRFGYSLEDFRAYVTADRLEQVKPFAGVLLDVLKRRGHEYAGIVEGIKQVFRPQCRSFSDLTHQETTAQDYDILTRIGGSGVVVLAIHGGNLQPGTTQIASAVAGDVHSFYSFVSRRPEIDQTLYIPSTQFDDPAALEIVGNAEVALSIHGCQGRDEFIKVGGLDLVCRAQIRDALQGAGFIIADDDSGGTNPANICNRGRTDQGVQLEISRGLRDRLIDSAGHVRDEILFNQLVEVLQYSLRVAILTEDPTMQPSPDLESAGGTFPNLEPFDFIDAQLVDETAPEPETVFPPPLQTEEFTVITFQTQPAGDSEELERFEFTVATFIRNGSKWNIQRQRHSAYRFVEVLPVASDPSFFAGVAKRLGFQGDSDSLGLEMVAIPGGTFTMGSPKSEPERFSYESPQHEVTLESFFMGRYLVTQTQWRAVAALPQVERELEPDPSNFKGSDRPVERLSWYDAVEFCARFSAYTGREYRLPTEAEWEYACRAGTDTPFHFGEMIATKVANYNGSAYAGGVRGERRGDTTPVTYFGIANWFGLSDMHGNVREWCQDHWHKNYEGAPMDGSAWLSSDVGKDRVRRGGSWLSDPRYCRSAFRGFLQSDVRLNYIGFRVCCSPPRTLT